MSRRQLVRISGVLLNNMENECIEKIHIIRIVNICELLKNHIAKTSSCFIQFTI